MEVICWAIPLVRRGSAVGTTDCIPLSPQQSRECAGCGGGLVQPLQRLTQPKATVAVAQPLVGNHYTGAGQVTVTVSPHSLSRLPFMSRHWIRKTRRSVIVIRNPSL